MRQQLTLLIALIVICQAPFAYAQTPEPNRTARLILVTGAAGTDEYGEQFEKDSQQWIELAKARMMEVVHLSSGKVSGEKAASEPGNQRDQLQESLKRAVADAPDQLWIVLIGHGTSERGNHKFNLVGPDFSAKELNEWCRAYTGQLVVINCSSASAPFLVELSGLGRVVITATRSGSENNYSRFGDQLAASILDPATDIDHDDEVSLLEAFLAAAAKTEKIYKELSRLATEHALLDDNGDKLGTGAEFFRGTRTIKSAQGGKQLDGQVAARITLFVTPAGQQLSVDQQKQRAAIEQRLDTLRSRKPNPPTDEYWNELEKLMLELAAIYDQSR